MFEDLAMLKRSQIAILKKYRQVSQLVSATAPDANEKIQEAGDRRFGIFGESEEIDLNQKVSEFDNFMMPFLNSGMTTAIAQSCDRIIMMIFDAIHQIKEVSFRNQ